MSAIDQIIKVNISQQTSAVAQASFSIPLIVGPTATPWGPTEFARVYDEPASMLDDGFTTSSPEYVYAQEMFEQSLTPVEVVVGYRAPAVAQVDTFQVGAVASGHLYKFTMAGLIVSYTSGGSDTQQAILAALLADIATVFPTNAPVTGAVSGSGSGATLTLTSVNPGAGVSYSAIDSDLTHVALTPNYGIEDDMNNILSVNNDWYGACLCSNVDYDILQMAGFIETLKKIFLGATQDAAVPTTATTDIASIMKGASYKRSGLVYSPGSFNKGVEAAWLGGQLPQVPGSNNWAYNSLEGIDPDTLTDNQVSILIGVPVNGIVGKNVNIYRTLGGKNLTQMGQMAGGQYIDITVGVDWLQSAIQTNIFNALTSVAKIPYTDKGVAILLQCVKSAIDQGVVNGLIDGASPITLSAPPVLTVPISQRANRIAPTITFVCRLQGAINAVIVNGTVTV